MQNSWRKRRVGVRAARPAKEHALKKTLEATQQLPKFKTIKMGRSYTAQENRSYKKPHKETKHLDTKCQPKATQAATKPLKVKRYRSHQKAKANRSQKPQTLRINLKPLGGRNCKSHRSLDKQQKHKVEQNPFLHLLTGPNSRQITKS